MGPTVSLGAIRFGGQLKPVTSRFLWPRETWEGITLDSTKKGIFFKIALLRAYNSHSLSGING